MIQCRFMNCTYKQVQNNSLAITDIIFKMTIFKIVCKSIENKSFRNITHKKMNIINVMQLLKKASYAPETMTMWKLCLSLYT